MYLLIGMEAVCWILNIILWIHFWLRVSFPTVRLLCMCFHICICALMYVFMCDSSSPCLIMSWCCVFHWTLCRVRGYLCDERPTWGWLDTRPQLFIRPPTVFWALASICVGLCVCMCTSQQSETVLHPCELSHVNDTKLQGILSLFVLLPPQGPPLPPISFHLCLPSQMKLHIPFK